MAVGRCGLVCLAHRCCDWRPGGRCGWVCSQLTSRVDGGMAGSRLGWSVLAWCVTPQSGNQADGHCYCVKPPCGGGLINGINKADLGKLRRRERSEVRSDLGTRFVLCEKTRHFHLQLITFNDGLLSIIGINYRTINYYQSINRSVSQSVSQSINRSISQSVNQWDL